MIQSRKRGEEEGEDEGGTVQELEDDSLSEVSAGSDADDDADGEASDDSESEGPAKIPAIPVATTNGRHSKIDPPLTDTTDTETNTMTATNADTEAMMNGLQISQEADAEVVDFDEAVKINGAVQVPVGPSASVHGNPVEARRREHEEYKKRRDADPAFVPNRGGFFMHDQRSGGSVQNGLRPFGRGAARGRGVPRGSFHGMRYVMQPPTFQVCMCSNYALVTRNLPALPIKLGLTISMTPSLAQINANYKIGVPVKSSRLASNRRLFHNLVVPTETSRRLAIWETCRFDC